MEGDRPIQECLRGESLSSLSTGALLLLLLLNKVLMMYTLYLFSWVEGLRKRKYTSETLNGVYVKLVLRGFFLSKPSSIFRQLKESKQYVYPCGHHFFLFLLWLDTTPVALV